MISRIFLAFLIISIAACSTDFDLTTEGRDVPVVYSILSEDNEFHYVRVEKVLLDEDISPIDLAKDSNEVFYDNVQVELIKGEESVVLSKVDASEIGMPRDSGIFLSEPNYLYRVADTEFNIGPEDIVNLRVTFPSDTLVATASAEIVGKSRLKSPNPDPDDKGTISLEPMQGFDEFVRWDVDEDAKFVDLYFNLHIREFKGNTTEFKEVLWPIVKGLNVDLAQNVGERFTVRGTSFFNFLDVTLEADPTIRRKLDSCDIIIDTGGEAMDRFIEINNLNTGITSSQVIPNFTNIENGLGLFSSSSSLVETGFRFEPRTIDALLSDPDVQDLNFIR
jgi:hypothetical protein